MELIEIGVRYNELVNSYSFLYRHSREKKDNFTYLRDGDTINVEIKSYNRFIFECHSFKIDTYVYQNELQAEFLKYFDFSLEAKRCMRHFLAYILSGFTPEKIYIDIYTKKNDSNKFEKNHHIFINLLSFKKFLLDNNIIDLRTKDT